MLSAEDGAQRHVELRWRRIWPYDRNQLLPTDRPVPLRGEKREGQPALAAVQKGEETLGSKLRAALRKGPALFKCGCLPTRGSTSSTPLIHSTKLREHCAPASLSVRGATLLPW